MQVSKIIAAVQVAPAAPGDPEINLDLANLSPRKQIVYRFYKQLWDKGDLAAIAELCQENFSFRGSLGPDLIGQSQFREYVCWVTETLDGYTSDILALIEEADQIAVKLRFHGRHRKALFGCPPLAIEFGGMDWRSLALRASKFDTYGCSAISTASSDGWARHIPQSGIHASELGAV